MYSLNRIIYGPYSILSCQVSISVLDTARCFERLDVSVLDEALLQIRAEGSFASRARAFTMNATESLIMSALKA